MLALRVALCLSIVCWAEAQDSALEAVKSEAAILRQSSRISEPITWSGKSLLPFHTALRNWVASTLPKSRTALDVQLPLLAAALNSTLKRAGLFVAAGFDRFGFAPGSLTRLELFQSPEDPDKLIVTVGIDIPCGSDEAAYVYDYGSGEPRRVLESHGTRDRDESISGVFISKPDPFAGQLFLTLRYGVQCGSSWNSVHYDVFRISEAPILSGEHGIWFGAAHPYQVRLGPKDLLLEVRDRSIDSGIHNRAHVLHFKLAGSTAERVDPVALLPRDFVDEWLTRPWSEMESRSAESERDKLQKWHEFLADGFVAAEFQLVQQCRELPGQWQVGINLDAVHGKELPEPLRLFFLVQQTGGYQFKMSGVSFDRQEGCPGESQPIDAGPTLFPAIPF